MRQSEKLGVAMTVIIYVIVFAIMAGCNSMPTAPKITCKKWSGAPTVAKVGGFSVRAHPDSVCSVR